MGKGLLVICSLVLLSACQQTEPLDAVTLSKELLIVDTHIDVPYRLMREFEDVSLATNEGQFDYPRAKQGGLNVAFMSIYTSAAAEEKGNSKTLADELIDMIVLLETDHPSKFTVVRSTSEIDTQFPDDTIMLALGMENGGPIQGSFGNLQHFYNRGVRYITLAHSKSNHISDSSYDGNRQWGGLSPFGRELISAMNRLGIMIDVSHISDSAFYDVISLSTSPVIASHSSVRHFIPGFERNMDDPMLRALARNGGVIQLNIGSTFLSLASRQSSEARNGLLRAYIEVNNISPQDSAAVANARDLIYAEHPLVYATMSDVLDHVDHVVELIGIEHVGIGSDFDGVGDSLPIGFKDVSAYPNFIDGLIQRDYSKNDIEKILGGNLMRVWRQVENDSAQDLNPVTGG